MFIVRLYLETYLYWWHIYNHISVYLVKYKDEYLCRIHRFLGWKCQVLLFWFQGFAKVWFAVQLISVYKGRGGVQPEFIQRKIWTNNFCIQGSGWFRILFISSSKKIVLSEPKIPVVAIWGKYMRNDKTMHKMFAIKIVWILICYALLFQKEY